MNFISFDCGIVTFAHITGTVNSLAFDPMLKIISAADVSIRDLATMNLNAIKLATDTPPNATLKLLTALKIHLDNITHTLAPANTIAFIEQQMKISPDIYTIYAATIMYLLTKGFAVQVVGATIKNKYSFNSKLTNEFHQINNKGIKAHALNNFTYYLSAAHPDIYRAINKTQAYLVHISDAFMQMICFVLEHAPYYPRVTFTQMKYVEAATLISIAPNTLDNKSVLDNIVKKISKEKKSSAPTSKPATIKSKTSSASNVLSNVFDLFTEPPLPLQSALPTALPSVLPSALPSVLPSTLPSVLPTIIVTAATPPPITPLIPVVDIPPGGIDLSITDLNSNTRANIDLISNPTSADIIALMTAAIDREIDYELDAYTLEPAFEMNLRGDYFAAESAAQLPG